MQSTDLIKPLIYLISIVFNLGAGFIIFLRDIRNKINIVFLGIALSVCGWLFSLFLFYFTSESELALWLGRINFTVALFIFYSFLEFAIVFPEKITIVPPKIEKIIQGICIIRQHSQPSHEPRPAQ